MRKTLIGVTMCELILKKHVHVSPLVVAWKRFAAKVTEKYPGAKFVLLYNGPGATEHREAFEPFQFMEIDGSPNVGHFVDGLANLATDQGFASFMMCEADSFYLLDDFLGLLEELNGDTIEYLVANNRTGWICNEPSLNVGDGSYHLPMGKTTPSTGPFGMTVEFYKKFLSEYSNVFGYTSRSTMSTESLSYEVVCSLFGQQPRPEIDRNMILCLDAFVRSNAWVLFCLNEDTWTRGVVVNYDDKSFYCKSQVACYQSIKDQSKSVVTAIDNEPKPEIVGRKIKCPFFHIGYGFLLSGYYSAGANPDAYFENHFQKLKDKTWQAAHFSILWFLANELDCSAAVELHQFRDAVGEDFINEVVEFYRPALADYF